MRIHKRNLIVVISVLSPLLTACASSGGNKSAITADEGAVVSAQESELRAIVERRVKTINESATTSRSRLLRRKPYFYKEYAEYPSGVNGMTLTINEADSRTSPYWAEVQLAKVRYATSLSRNRSEAHSNGDFVRATGMETTSYQLRNGKWVRVGSLFVAEKRETLVEGQWQPAQGLSGRIPQLDDATAPTGNIITRGWRRLRGEE